MARQPLYRTRKIFLPNAWREFLVITEENLVGSNLPDRHEKIFWIAEDGTRVWECFFDDAPTVTFTLFG